MYWHPSSATSFLSIYIKVLKTPVSLGETNNLSTLLILSKRSSSMNFSPLCFPLGQAVAAMDVTEKLEMLPPLPFPLWYFSSGPLCSLNRTLFEVCFYSFTAWQTHTVRRQAYKNHRSPAGSSTVGVILDTALHSSCTFSRFQVDSVPLAYRSSSWEIRGVNPNENTSSTSTQTNRSSPVIVLSFGHRTLVKKISRKKKKDGCVGRRYWKVLQLQGRWKEGCGS